MLIAPAWDMTELMWRRFSDEAKAAIRDAGVWLRPSAYGDGPTRSPASSSRTDAGTCWAASRSIPGRPVHIMHGLQDPDVPWQHTLDLVALLSGDWTRVTAVAGRRAPAVAAGGYRPYVPASPTTCLQGRERRLQGRCGRPSRQRTSSSSSGLQRLPQHRPAHREEFLERRLEAAELGRPDRQRQRQHAAAGEVLAELHHVEVQ